MRKVSFLIALVVCLILVIIPAVGQCVTLSRGQIVYAPAAHNCIRYDEENGELCIRSFQTGLTIRNIDLNFPITLISIQLYDPDGNFVDEFLKSGPIILNHLASISFRTSGYYLWGWEEGRPSFIVRWKSNRYVNAPIIETGRTVLDGYGYETTWQAMDITTGTVLKEAP
jgi:hypothetical protein